MKSPAPNAVCFSSDTPSITVVAVTRSPTRRYLSYSCSQFVATMAVKPASSRTRSRSGIGAPGPGPGAPMPDLLRVLDEAGFTAIVATNCEQEYDRYLRVGDRVTATTVIEGVSEEKQTALGAGDFITTRITYTDQ